MENFATPHAQARIDIVFMENEHVVSYLTLALALIEGELDHARRVPYVVTEDEIAQLEAAYDAASDNLSAEMRFSSNYEEVAA